MPWRPGLARLRSPFSIALLLAVALLLVNLWQSAHVPGGSDAERVLAVEMELTSPRYVFVPTPPPPPPPEPGARVTPAPPKPAPSQTARRPDQPTAALGAFQQQLIGLVLSLPGVINAGTTSALPFQNPTTRIELKRAGAPGSGFGYVFYVDPGYLTTLNVPVLRGRNFTHDDTRGSLRVAMISSKVARDLFGDEDPIGQLVNMHGPVRVVGVVGDIRYQGVENNPEPAIYFPLAQSVSFRICLVVRTAPGADDVEKGIRGVVSLLDPDLRIISMKSVEQIAASVGATANQR